MHFVSKLIVFYNLSIFFIYAHVPGQLLIWQWSKCLKGVFAKNEKGYGLHFCIPSPLAPGPIRGQSYLFCLFWTIRNTMALTYIFLSISWGEEGQPHQSLVPTTFSFSRPHHIEILVNIIQYYFFLSVRSLKINTFFKNIATLGHKTWLE